MKKSKSRARKGSLHSGLQSGLQTGLNDMRDAIETLRHMLDGYLSRSRKGKAATRAGGRPAARKSSGRKSSARKVTAGKKTPTARKAGGTASRKRKAS
jgi:hypothetical protein